MKNLIIILALALPTFAQGIQGYTPTCDDGNSTITISSNAGTYEVYVINGFYSLSWSTYFRPDTNLTFTGKIIANLFNGSNHIPAVYDPVKSNLSMSNGSFSTNKDTVWVKNLYTGKYVPITWVVNFKLDPTTKISRPRPTTLKIYTPSKHYLQFNSLTPNIKSFDLQGRTIYTIAKQVTATY
jgi:hypothetical protein